MNGKQRDEHMDGEQSDDCAICRAMAMADKRGFDLSDDELLDAFEKQNAENDKNAKLPEVMITYRCENCGETTMLDDAREDEAECFICEKGDFLKEIKREPITPQIIADAMMKSAESMILNLQKAFEAGKKTGFDEGEEEELLQALAKTKEMRDSVLKMAEEVNRDGDKI